MSDTYKATCFCGAVEFEVSGAPVSMGYCHCRDCSAWAAAPVNAFSLWRRDTLRITKGEASIGTFNKTEGSARKFCAICGGHLMNDHPGLRLVDVFASVLQNFTHVPTLHVHYRNKTVSIKDGLPKFSDLPSKSGGSGETLPE